MISDRLSFSLKAFVIFFIGFFAFSSMVAAASANTIESSTMVFEGALTDDGDGSYSGVVPMVQNDGYGDSGFDVYAKNGAWSTYDKLTSGSDYAEGQVTDHDVYTTAGGWGSEYNPDVSDWYNYQLKFDSTSWYVEYNANVGNDGILTGASAPPMSGSVDWNNMYATETGTGEYYTGMGTPQNDGYAASFATNHSQLTQGAWDMDWSWGSEYVPLEYAGFYTVVYDLGSGNYRVTMFPAESGYVPSVVYVDDSDATCAGQSPCFSSIQDAIDAVAVGGTVNVAAGTYTENLVIDKELSLIGASSSDTNIAGDVSGTVVIISANNVLVSDFKITGFMTYSSETTGAYSNIEIDCSVDDVYEGNGIFLDAVSGCTIENNIVDYEKGIGIKLQNADGNIIQNNIIEDSYVSGIALFGSGSNAIENNQVTGSQQVKCDGNYMGYGIFLDYAPPDGTPTTYSTGNTINNNIFSNNDVDGVYFGEFSNSNILTSNTITDNGGTYKKDSNGVYFWKSSENTVEGNTITGNTQSGIELMGSHNNTITYNTITGNNWDTSYYKTNQGSGVLLRISSSSSTQGNVINENIIYGNTEYDIFVNDLSISADAERNYWGVSNPDFNTIISGNVDYTPWYLDEGLTMLSSTVDLNNVYVDDGYSDAASCESDGHFWGYNCFATIKDAIDAVSEGGTVNVAEGNYEESGQIVIGKDLTIRGSGKTATTIETDTDTGSAGDSRGWFLVNAGVEFHLNDVTLDGSNHKVYQAIRYNGAGSVSDCIIKNIKYSTYSGMGVAAMGDGDVDVTNTEFSNIERIGVIYFGNSVTNSVFSGNTYIGKGDGNWLDYGVEVGGGAKAQISNSDISECKGVATSDGSTSAGILVTTYYDAGSEAIVGGNLLHDNTAGLAIGYDSSDSSTVTVNNNNEIYNNDYGIETSSSNSIYLVIENNDFHDNTVQLKDDSSTMVIEDVLTENTFDRAVVIDRPLSSLLHIIWSSIQDAIDDSVSGDTIQVYPGTYSESLLIDKSLTLVGVGTKPVVTGNSQNYIIKVDGANVVTIDNLEVNGGGSGTGDNAFSFGLLITNSESVTVTNSLVMNIWKAGSNGIDVSGSTNVDINGNTLVQVHKRYIRYTDSDGKVYSNNIIGDNVDGTSRVQNLVNLWGGSDVEIYGNTLRNALSPGETRTWDSPGIFVSSYGGSGDSYANIHDNEIYNCDSGIIIGSVYSTTDSSNADITNNNLHDLERAIIFEVERDDDSGLNTVSAVISGNTFADNVNNYYHAVNIDGTDNYYGGIQQAIDVATEGNTIKVSPGTYEENVATIKSIKVIGSGSNETSISPKSGICVKIPSWSLPQPDHGSVDGFKLQGFTLIPVNGSLAVLVGSGTADGTYYNTNLEFDDIVIDGGNFGIGLNSVSGVTFTNVHIKNLDGDSGALELTGVHNLFFSGGSIENNAIGIRLQNSPGVSWGDYGQNGDIRIKNSTIMGNTMSIENQDANFNINATENWWGHAYGPYHSTNEDGLGNEVSDNVDFKPYYIDAAMTTLSSDSQTNLENDTLVDESKTEVVIPSNNNNATITVPNNVTNATINVASLMNTTGNTSTATLNGGINVTVNTTLGNVSIEIPQNIAISGSTSWNGIINLPTIKETASTNPAPSSGKTVNTGTISVIEIGFGDIELTFDKAVRILVPGKAGQLVGYSRSGVFTPITNVCLADTQAFGDALPDGGDCKMDVGSDMVIWTKHFTEFMTYTETTTTTTTASTPSGGGGGAGGVAPSLSMRITDKLTTIEQSEGSNARYYVEVENRGSSSGTFSLEITGLSSSYYSIDSSITLGSLGTSTSKGKLYYTLNLPDNAEDQTYTVTVKGVAGLLTAVESFEVELKILPAGATTTTTTTVPDTTTTTTVPGIVIPTDQIGGAITGFFTMAEVQMGIVSLAVAIAVILGLHFVAKRKKPWNTNYYQSSKNGVLDSMKKHVRRSIRDEDWVRRL